MMQTRIIFSILVIFALAGCIGLTGEFAPSPTSAPDREVTPVSAHTAESTQDGNSAALADYPLAVHSLWTYAAEISYQRPGTTDQIDRWAGLVTRTVTGEERSVDGRTTFTTQLEMDPPIPAEVWSQPQSETYVLENGVIMRDGIRLYQWPLSDGASWKAWPDAEYTWHVSAQTTVDTPYRIFDDCYLVVLNTNPDTTADTLCPGVGLVMHDYMHHGTPQTEHWELIEFHK